MARSGSVKDSKVKNKKIKKDKKIVIKNQKKILMAISVIAIFAIVVIILFVNNKKDLSTIDDYSKLNVRKYSTELLEEYNKEEGKEKFLEDYDLVQSAVGMYIMNNSTNSANSFTSLIEELKVELKKENWENLECDKPKFWNGEYSIDDNGIVKFKFGNKSIEPSWIKDDEFNEKIVLN